MKRYNIPHCSIREIDRNGIAHCMEKILDMINRRYRIAFTEKLQFSCGFEPFFKAIHFCKKK